MGPEEQGPESDPPGLGDPEGRRAVLPSVSADRTGVAPGLPGHGLTARAFLTDTPAEVMQLPVQDVADSKEQMILRAVCDERISVPVESLMQFPEVYKALMDRIGGPGAIYRKLGYTDDMIKLMGLDPSAPGCRTGADGPDIRPRGGEGDEGIVYPPITSDNVQPEEELSG